MKIRNINIGLVLICSLIFTACLNDLDTEPEVEQTLENLLKENPNAAKELLAKLYSSMVTHGQGVPGGSNQQEDIIGDDAGETVYFRSLWNLQEMTTDVVKNIWGDGGLDPLTTASAWSSENKFFGYMYNKAYFIIGQCNNFIVDVNNVDVDEKDLMIAEARFIRAMMYYNLIDCFGGVPLVTDEDGIGPADKARSSRQEIFNFVESELVALESLIPDEIEYGRVNKATIQMLLAKLYLNAEVWTGSERWEDCLSNCEKVINESSFTLMDNYLANFTGDNHLSTEIIFPLIGDADFVQSFGNTTYLINGSSSSETMIPLDTFGAQNGWTGHRCTPALYSKFGDLNLTPDSRALFWTSGHTYDMEDYRNWTNGYPTTKFRNDFADGTKNVTNFSDVDVPLFRLADAHLMYIECVLRGATNGDRGTALTYANALRERAYGSADGNISDAQMTLEWVIDERARELYFEGHRRQDLIRFGLFTGGEYLWPWKGNVEDGAAIPEFYNLFPLPLEALQANPNLVQNPGY